MSDAAPSQGREARRPRGCAACPSERRADSRATLGARAQRLAGVGGCRDARALVAGAICPGPFALSSSFGAQAAVSLHLVAQADPADPGDPDRHRLSIPRDLPVHRAAAKQLSLNIQTFSSQQSVARVRGAARQALGAGARRPRPVPRAAQGRADAPRAERRSARRPGSPACAAARPRAARNAESAGSARRPLQGSSDLRLVRSRRVPVPQGARAAVSPALGPGLRVHRRLALDQGAAAKWSRPRSCASPASSASAASTAWKADCDCPVAERATVPTTPHCCESHS